MPGVLGPIPHPQWHPRTRSSGRDPARGHPSPRSTSSTTLLTPSSLRHQPALVDVHSIGLKLVRPALLSPLNRGSLLRGCSGSRALPVLCATGRSRSWCGISAGTANSRITIDRHSLCGAAHASARNNSGCVLLVAWLQTSLQSPHRGYCLRYTRCMSFPNSTGPPER